MAEDNTLKVYALDDGANKHETMTKEQVLAAIIQAVEDGTITNIDTGFITKIKEMNKQTNLKVWVGTNAEFTALETKAEDTLYLFTDDPTIDDMEQAVTEVEEAQNDLMSGLNDGSVKPNTAQNADRATKAGYNEVNGHLKAERSYQATSSVTVTLTNDDIQKIQYLSSVNGSIRARLILDLRLQNLKKKYPSETIFTEVDSEVFPNEVYHVEIPMWLSWYKGFDDAQLDINAEDNTYTKSFVYDHFSDPDSTSEDVTIYHRFFSLTFYFSSKGTNTFTLKWDTTGYTDSQQYTPVKTGLIRGYNKTTSNVSATMQLISGATWFVDAYRFEIDEEF